MSLRRSLACRAWGREVPGPDRVRYRNVGETQGRGEQFVSLELKNILPPRSVGYCAGVASVRVKPRIERLARRSFGHTEGALLELRML
jgi:hypothetical protein